ncbi:hypothetical protein ACWGB8_07070 [Kitasatospora sp. NPDC054939]
MRSASVVCTGVRIRLGLLLGHAVPRRLGPALSAVAAVAACWLLTGRGVLPDGAAPALLAAGGWGLGLIPVHADRLATGPVRRTGEPAAPTEQPSPNG